MTQLINETKADLKLNFSERLQKKINEIAYAENEHYKMEGSEIRIIKEIQGLGRIWHNGKISEYYGGGQIADTGDYNDSTLIATIDSGFGYVNQDISEYDPDEEDGELLILGLPLNLDLILSAISKKYDFVTSWWNKDSMAIIIEKEPRINEYPKVLIYTINKPLDIKATKVLCEWFDID